MHRPLYAAMAILLLAATAARAQSAPAPESRRSPIGFRFAYAAGLTSGIQASPGLSLSLGADMATPLSVLRFRLEGGFVQRRSHDVFGLASLTLSPLGARSPFYVAGGLGSYVYNGVNRAGMIGSGIDMGKLTRLPLFLEYRAFLGRTEFSVLSIGVHF